MLFCPKHTIGQKMEEEIELYVNTCLVCEQDKVLQQKEALSVSFDGFHYEISGS